MNESDFSLASLMQELRATVQDISERRLILPRTLGDLDKPECLAEMHDRIQKLKQDKYLLDSGQITQMEYNIWKDEILSKKTCFQFPNREIKSSSDEAARRTTAH